MIVAPNDERIVATKLISYSNFDNQILTTKKHKRMKKNTLIFVCYLIAVALSIFAASKAHSQTWQPNPKYVKSTRDSTSKASETKYQCYGTTAKGERCKRLVNADHSFCYQHKEQGK